MKIDFANLFVKYGAATAKKIKQNVVGVVVVVMKMCFKLIDRLVTSKPRKNQIMAASDQEKRGKTVCV